MPSQFECADVEHTGIVVHEDTPTGRRTIWIAPGCDSPAFRTFLRSLDTHMRDGATIFIERNQLVRFEPDARYGIGKSIVVKRFSNTRAYDQLRFRLIPSKARRSLRIAQALRHASINTPAPVAMVEERGKFRQLLCNYFVTVHIDNAESLLHTRINERHPDWPTVRDSYLPRIARDARRMHDAGIVHNDFHGGNVLVRKTPAGDELYYIDLNRARIRRKLGVWARVKDLIRFELSVADQEILVCNYWPERFPCLLRLFRAAKRRRDFFLKLRGRG